MAFTTRTFSDITQNMLSYISGLSSTLTNFQVGSRTRLLLEASAQTFENLYTQSWENLKALIQERIYTAFDFPQLPAAPSVGTLTFTGTSGTVIPTGTVVSTPTSATQTGVQFQTTAQGTIGGGGSVTVNAQSVTAGSISNVGIGTVTQMNTYLSGVSAVTNPVAFIGGYDTETPQQQQLRFIGYINSLSRGTSDALVYAAKQVSGVVGAATVEQAQVYSITYDGASPIDNTAEANLPWGAPFPVYATSPNVGDSFNIGQAGKFSMVYINFATAGAGLNITWQYYNGAWTTLTATDNTTALTKSGTLTFTKPSDWVATTVDGYTGFFIRALLNSTTYTTMATVNHIFMLEPPPGVVNLYVYGAGGTASAGLISSVASQVGQYRAAGVTVNVLAPNLISQNVTVSVEIDNGFDVTSVTNTVQASITNYLNNLGVGSPVRFAKLQELAIDAYYGNAVLNSTFSEPTADIIVSSGDLIQAGTVTVNYTVPPV